MSTWVGLGEPIARGWSVEASSQSQTWRSPGQWDLTSPNTSWVQTVPWTLGLELRVQLPRWARESPLPRAFGARWAWLYISAPLASCVTLGKSLHLSKPLFPFIQQVEDHHHGLRGYSTVILGSS